MTSWENRSREEEFQLWAVEKGKPVFYRKTRTGTVPAIKAEFISDVKKELPVSCKFELSFDNKFYWVYPSDL